MSDSPALPPHAPPGAEAGPGDSAEPAVRLFQSTSRLTRFLRTVAGGQETSATWRVLGLIDEHGPLRVTELAGLDMLTQPSATSIVRRMVDEGLLERRPDPTDRRAGLVALTAHGRRRLAEHRDAAVAVLRPLIDELDEAGRADLDRAVDLLERLSAAGLDRVRTGGVTRTTATPAPDPERTA